MELVAPAGNLPKLKVALRYGADAFYLAYQSGGLRSLASNFNREELQEGVRLVHQQGKKVYLAINAFLTDFAEGEELLSWAQELAVDAVILSNIAMIKLAQKYNLTVHLSTQCSTLNSYTAQFYRELGVRRIVLARELSLAEIAKIKEIIDVEVFIHGSRCRSYSGMCYLSAFLSARDGNSGGCAHHCRLAYSYRDKQNYYLSSLDLKSVYNIKDFLFVTAGKIEGRMKSELYVAVTSKCYRYLIDHCSSLTESELIKIDQELDLLTHREYSEVRNDRKYSTTVYKKATFLALIMQVNADSCLLLMKNFCQKGDHLQFITFQGENVDYIVDHLYSYTDRSLQQAHPSQLIKLYLPAALLSKIHSDMVVRKIY